MLRVCACPRFEFLHLKGRPFEEDADPAAITRESILQVEHLLLPTLAFSTAADVVQSSNVVGASLCVRVCARVCLCMVLLKVVLCDVWAPFMQPCTQRY